MYEKKQISKDSAKVELFNDGKLIGLFNTPKLADEYIARQPKVEKIVFVSEASTSNSVNTVVNIEPTKRRGRPRK